MCKNSTGTYTDRGAGTTADTSMDKNTAPEMGFYSLSYPFNKFVIVSLSI